jgi:hypothetical protein
MPAYGQGSLHTAECTRPYNKCPLNQFLAMVHTITVIPVLVISEWGGGGGQKPILWQSDSCRKALNVFQTGENNNNVWMLYIFPLNAYKNNKKLPKYLCAYHSPLQAVIDKCLVET